MNIVPCLVTIYDTNTRVAVQLFSTPCIPIHDADKVNDLAYLLSHPDTERSRYNTVNILKNIHNSQPVARPQCMNYVLQLQMACCK